MTFPNKYGIVYHMYKFHIYPQHNHERLRHWRWRVNFMYVNFTYVSFFLSHTNTILTLNSHKLWCVSTQFGPSHSPNLFRFQWSMIGLVLVWSQPSGLLYTFSTILIKNCYVWGLTIRICNYLISIEGISGEVGCLVLDNDMDRGIIWAHEWWAMSQQNCHPLVHILQIDEKHWKANLCTLPCSLAITNNQLSLFINNRMCENKNLNQPPCLPSIVPFRPIGQSTVFLFQNNENLLKSNLV